MPSLLLMLILCAGLLMSGTAKPVTASTDCSSRFLVGSYGVPADEPAVRDGLLAVSGFTPIYLERHGVEVSDPATCEYVTAYDVFRLVYNQRRQLLAGCYGDFDGDGRRDYALLLRKADGSDVIPHIFLARPPGYSIIALDKVTDPYGFNEDHSLWPGPFCHGKPKDGIFQALESRIRVFGDVMQVGWYAYYWLPQEQRFQTVLVED